MQVPETVIIGDKDSNKQCDFAKIIVHWPDKTVEYVVESQKIVYNRNTYLTFEDHDNRRHELINVPIEIIWNIEKKGCELT